MLNRREHEIVLRLPIQVRTCHPTEGGTVDWTKVFGVQNQAHGTGVYSVDPNDGRVYEQVSHYLSEGFDIGIPELVGRVVRGLDCGQPGATRAR